MPEPVSVVASCLGIAKIAIGVSITLYTFIQGTKKVSKTVCSLQTVVDELIRTLEEIQKNLREPARRQAGIDDAEGLGLWETLEETLLSCRRTVSEMDTALVGLSDEGQSRVIRKIKLDFKETDIAAFITRIQVHIGTLSLNVQMFTL